MEAQMADPVIPTTPETPAPGAIPSAPVVPATPKPVDAAAAAGGETPPKDLKRVKLGASDEIPSDANLLELSPSSLKKRLERATAAELKSRFGTDDPEAIKKDLDELAEFRANKETARQAQLTKEQKLEEQVNIERQGRLTAESAAREAAALRDYDRDERRMSHIAGKFVDEDYVDGELTKFAKHLTQEFTAKQLGKMKDSEFAAEAEKFFTARIETKPKLAKNYADTLREDLKAELRGEKRDAKKVTNGAKPNTPESAARTNTEAKTFAPGKPNSYTEKEAREEMRKKGIRY